MILPSGTGLDSFVWFRPQVLAAPGEIRGNGFVKTTATALQSLEERARTQGDGVAVLVSGGTGRSAVTWTGLLSEVEVCAAGLARAGLHAGQVVLGAMRVDVRALVLQHAVRTVGATLLWVHPGADPAELAEVLDGAPVRFVVADEERLAEWGRLDLGSADVLRMDGDGLATVRVLGVERLQEAPSQIHLLDLHADAQLVRPRMLTPGAGVRATAPAPLPSTLTPVDVVLLVGDMADPHVQDALRQHLDSGSALALTHGVDDLADVLSANLPEELGDPDPFAPTVLRLARPDDADSTEEIRLLPAREVPRGDPEGLPRRRPRRAAEGFTNQGLDAASTPA